MIFTTYRFLVFLAAAIAAYYCCPVKVRWTVLLLASMVFYAFSGLLNLLYLTGVILTVYTAGRVIGALHVARDTYLAKHGDLSREEKKKVKSRNQAKRRLFLIVCLAVSLGGLAFVKTGGFFGILMPMGVSFYTFQSVGYIIDVYRGKSKPERNILKFALFCSFFPQMVQGPISRFDDLSETLFAGNRFDAKNVSFGLQRILLGFFKKLIIADRLLPVVLTVTGSPGEYQGIYVAAAVLLYAVTLYADFTGGIDIAIGAAEAMGIPLRENFNRPFYAVSIADYWRRWHITMGTWFKDYLFYPISVSKPLLKLSKFSRAKLGDGFGKRVPVYLSTITVWFATGIWHGANWNFITWGLVNGFVIILSEECSPLYARFHNRFPGVGQNTVYRAFTVVRTFCLMSLIRSFDIFAGVGTTLRALGSMFYTTGGFFQRGLSELGLPAAGYAAAFTGVLLLILLGLPRGGWREALAQQSHALRYVIIVMLLLVVIIFGVYGVGYDAQQFIYNRF